MTARSRKPAAARLLQWWTRFGIASAARLRPPYPLGCGCSSGVEHDLAKVGVEGSNPFARSNFQHRIRCRRCGAWPARRASAPRRGIANASRRAKTRWRRRSLPLEAEDIGDQVVGFRAPDDQIGHGPVARLQEYPERQGGRRWHVRDRGEVRAALPAAVPDASAWHSEHQAATRRRPAATSPTRSCA